MEKHDARTFNQQTQFVLRKQIVKLRKKGVSNKATADIVGMSEAHTCTIWRKYIREGTEALKPGKRGRQHGTKRVLDSGLEKVVRKMLVDKTPDQLKLPFALWTRDAVRQAIRVTFGLDIPLRTITDYLKRWGFTPQKPTKRAYEQDPKKLNQWLEQGYPEIAVRAKEEKAEIHWGDETGINNESYNVRGFAPRGKTPVVRLHAKRSSINMISSITNQGKVRFMLYQETLTGSVFIRFLVRLIKDAERKVFLILDNHRVHHNKQAKKWLEKHIEEIEVFFLPPYSPEHNPDEYLNGDLKQKIRSGIPSRTQGDLSQKTRSFMKTLQHRPEHVKNYFQHHMVRYAA